ncbi:MAG TPA: AAA family ATPase [Solirubrobacterales bacterium]|nr:AAA family ATPase [Solirubrobacterales bacterium]
MSLLERECELGELRAALEEVRAGRGCGLMIEASAGLGKTRLLQEARELGVEAGLTVVSARATELERDYAFGLVQQLFNHRLRALAEEEREDVLEGAGAARPALGLASGDEQNRDSFSVLHGLYWVTASQAERQPLLLAVDDIHWADTASLDYLAFLLTRLEELPALLLLTVRPDVPGQPPRLTQVLGDPVLRRLSPSPLSLKGAACLLASELDREPDPAFASACFEVSGGNPFLLTELSRTLLERGIEPTADQAESARGLAPERVARSVLLRVERLSGAAGKVAQALAILGDGSDLSLLAELAGLELKAVRGAADELRTSAVFDGGDSLRFIHPLVRNAIYSEVTVGERARTHRRAATLLQERGASPEEIATQLVAGEPQGDRASVETLLEAGDRALATGAPRAAVAYMTRAWEEPPLADMRVDVLDQLITASFHAGDASALPAVEADVVRAAENDRSLLSRWGMPLTMVMAIQGRFEEGASMVKEAIEVAVAEGDVERAFQLEAHLSTLALMVPSVPKVNLERYLDEIDPDSPAGRLAATIRIRSAMVNGTAEETAEAARWALANDGILFNEESELAAAGISVIALVVTDEVDEGLKAAEQALATAEEIGGVPQRIRGWYLRGFASWASGDLVGAEADIRQAIDLARLAGMFPMVVMITPSLVEILIERDELDAAEAELRGLGLDAGPSPPTFGSVLLLIIRGHLRWEQRRVEEAAADFAALAAIAEDLALGPAPIAMAAPWAAGTLIATGERERARELAEDTLAWARRWGAPSSIAHVERAVAAARGGTEGVELLREAVAVLEGSPRRLERVHALVDLGAALRAAGRRRDARAPLREGLQLARRCGATRAAKRATAELQATGLTVRRYTPIGVESLTPSERRVAELAASGMTNRQIAQLLFVTVKTVEAHLSAAYDKLDIGSRGELANALKEADPSGES